MGEVVKFKDRDKIVDDLSNRVVNFLCYIYKDLGCRNNIEYFELQEFLNYYYDRYDDMGFINKIVVDFEKCFDIEEFEILDNNICIFKIDNLVEVMEDFLEEEYYDEEELEVTEMSISDIEEMREDDIIEELVTKVDYFSIELSDLYGISSNIDGDDLRDCLSNYYDLYKEYNTKVFVDDFIDGLYIVRSLVDEEFSFNIFTIESMMLDRYNNSIKDRFCDKINSKVKSFRRGDNDGDSY